MLKTNTYRPGALAAALVVGLAAAGMTVANALGTGGTRDSVLKGHPRRTGIAVFKHHPAGLAHTAKSDARGLPPDNDSTLAAVVGSTEIFVLHNSSGDDCIMHLTAGGVGGQICNSPSHVESEGELGVGLVAAGVVSPGSAESIHVDGLLPNGVSTIHISDRDGSSYEVPVANNVVYHEDSRMAVVSYMLPGGATVTTYVAALLDHLPRAQGSSTSR